MAWFQSFLRQHKLVDIKFFGPYKLADDLMSSVWLILMALKNLTSKSKANKTFKYVSRLTLFIFYCFGASN